MDSHVSRTISVPRHVPGDGVRIEPEGGSLMVSLSSVEVVIAGDAAGLRDLARWCLALSDSGVPLGAHTHLDPGAGLEDGSVSLIVERRD